ncbi:MULTISPECIES: hypothetical protein [Rhizobium/Agrobacterium group]|jgi:hypothetical protein|uniref:Uncharacterized protein n=1 Tax=Rhizobium soli TaxID=424798 RepID=A0A7X0MUF5_9HYPH|nr:MULTISPECIES: hypothetical protein [Rhizobium/Agrobacterium group]MBB6509418.1 hypothetical protein [Rhizobium soli]MBD8650442.1 hypothetical protein [Rhizobium sp. CFBP 13726]MBD8663150.1 hypothetical protein [Rhizobium sp. CFBP 8752]MBP2461155.1 hypothetical protein [Rhizobium sp. PvP014]MBP2528551.1 hypothetical protein [Rhizobium sp. PvP099]
MSKETEHTSQPSEQAIGLFLQDGDGDSLTDVLVEALYEAFRIMDDDVSTETYH